MGSSSSSEQSESMLSWQALQWNACDEQASLPPRRARGVLAVQPSLFCWPHRPQSPRHIATLSDEVAIHLATVLRALMLCFCVPNCCYTGSN